MGLRALHERQPFAPDTDNSGVGRDIGGPYPKGDAVFLLHMNLLVNGQEYSPSASKTLKDLILEMKLVPETLAAEVNFKVIKKSEYEKTELKDGDSIELVRFVGGG